MISESELRALPPEEQERLFLAQAHAAEPGKLVRIGDFIPTAPPAPGPIAMAANLAGAVAGHIADGCREAPPGARAAREAICAACPHFERAEDRCRICGCHLSIKRSWASSACPDDPPRWDAV